MASPATTETIEIRRRGRRRLIGAVTIVVLLVVFVPMLLDSEPHRTANEPATKIPSKDNAAPLPAPAPSAKAPLPAAASASTPPAAANAPSPAKPAATVTPAPRPKSVPAPAAVPAQAAPRLEGFAVQVGAFKDEQTLQQARGKLAAAGVPHYTERIEGGLTRLRAGPFPTREAAEKARASLKQAALEGQVVSLP